MVCFLGVLGGLTLKVGEREWERRWRGLAQIQGAQVVWYDHAGFDRSAAVALLEHCQR